MMSPRPAVSAHRGGTEHAAPATWEAYQDALASGAEYVEFDVRRTADGVLVVHHDARVGGTGPLLSTLTRAELDARAGHPVPVVEDVMELIAGKLVAHLDLKETGYERELLDRAVALLGEDGVVATTLEDRSVAALTAARPRVRTLLSLGRDGRGLGKRRLRCAPGSANCCRCAASAPAAPTGSPCISGWRAPPCCARPPAADCSRWCGRSTTTRRCARSSPTGAWTCWSPTVPAAR